MTMLNEDSLEFKIAQDVCDLLSKAFVGIAHLPKEVVGAALFNHAHSIRQHLAIVSEVMLVEAAAQVLYRENDMSDLTFLRTGIWSGYRAQQKNVQGKTHTVIPFPVVFTRGEKE